MLYRHFYLDARKESETEKMVFSNYHLKDKVLKLNNYLNLFNLSKPSLLQLILNKIIFKMSKSSKDMGFIAFSKLTSNCVILDVAIPYHLKSKINVIFNLKSYLTKEINYIFSQFKILLCCENHSILAVFTYKIIRLAITKNILNI